MNPTSRPRGLGIRTRLALVSLVLAVLPWLVLQYQREIDAFVLEGRKSALVLAAQGVATVLHDREGLFDEQGGLPILLGDSRDFSPLPLEAAVQLDGNGRDWSNLAERRRQYGLEETLQPGEAGAPPSLTFDLALGRRQGFLYALFEVSDDLVVLRPERYRRLDASDHLRITLRQEKGVLQRYLVTAAEPGPTTTYAVGESFRYALGDGLPEGRVRGHWRETPNGYAVELRFPLDMLGPAKEVGFAVADVDRSGAEVSRVVGTFPRGRASELNLVLLSSPEIERILRGLDLPGGRITVVDHLERVRAEVGVVQPARDAAARERLLRDALAPIASTSEVAHSGPETTRAAWPIRNAERVVGAVLIEQSNREILSHQRFALERVLVAMAIACIAIAVVLWLFAWRVTHRIHSLRDEASAAIDPKGRILRSSLEAGASAGDEIGDLSRTISALLARLSRYTSFLEQIPRTLHHELSNPLNTLSTSLQNLVREHPEIEKSKYIESAERGVERVGGILQGITDAANLEEALRDDELENVDLAELTRCYVENFARSAPERAFSLRAPNEPVQVYASSFRLEQLLDKLVDNAVSFSPESSEIGIELVVRGARAQLTVSNEGPPLPAELYGRLFDSMVTSRTAGHGDRPHLGIGLYVVHLIAEHAGASVQASNREDGRGVRVCVDWPLAKG